MENENIEFENEIPKKDNPYTIPIAIIIAGVMISVTIIFTTAQNPSNKVKRNPNVFAL